jgi:5'-nucleotidase
VLSDIDVVIDPATRNVTSVNATNRLVTRNDPSAPANATLAGIINGYKTLVSPVANAVLGSISAALPIARADAACNMPAGNLIADAQLDATRATGLGEAVIAFMNGGGVRSPGFTFAQSAAGEGDGNVTYGEAFTVQPFGNSLVTMSLTSQQIKDFLEEQFAGCQGQSATATRFALPSAGFKYTWDGSKACKSRIIGATLTSGATTEVLVDAGVAVNPTKLYRVTVNNFMADGGDGYSTLKAGTNRVGGAQDIDALVAFLAKFKMPAAPYTPANVPNDGGKARISRIGGTTCPSGADVNP